MKYWNDSSSKIFVKILAIVKILAMNKEVKFIRILRHTNIGSKVCERNTRFGSNCMGCPLFAYCDSLISASSTAVLAFVQLVAMKSWMKRICVSGFNVSWILRAIKVYNTVYPKQSYSLFVRVNIALWSFSWSMFTVCIFPFPPVINSFS